jgi:membrane-associated protein
MLVEYLRHRRQAKAIAAELGEAAGDIAESATGADQRP